MRITSKGQVTIPQAIRDKLGLLPDTEVEFEVDGDAVRVRRAASVQRTDRGRALIAHMRGRGTRRLSTDEIMKLVQRKAEAGKTETVAQLEPLEAQEEEGAGRGNIVDLTELLQRSLRRGSGKKAEADAEAAEPESKRTGTARKKAARKRA